MADKPVGEVVAVDAVLDALSSPTSSDVYEAMQPFSNDAVGAVAAKRALGGGGGGASFPDEWTVGADGSLDVSDTPSGSAFFSLSPEILETFAAVLRVYNSATLDDCDLIAKNDNGNIHLRIVSSGDGFLRAYKPDNSVYFELDSSSGLVKLNGETFAGFPVTLAEDDVVRFSSASDPTTAITVTNLAGHLVINGEDAGITTFALATSGSMTLVDGAQVFTTPTPLPVIPATPTAQDVVDALVTLGLVTQAS